MVAPKRLNWLSHNLTNPHGASPIVGAQTFKHCSMIFNMEYFGSMLSSSSFYPISKLKGIENESAITFNPNITSSWNCMLKLLKNHVFFHPLQIILFMFFTCYYSVASKLPFCCKNSRHKAWREKIFKVNYLGCNAKLFYTKGLISFHPRSMFLPIVILVDE